MKTILNPPTVALGKGLFSHVVSIDVASSTLVFISGQVSWTSEGEVIGRANFREQFVQVYRNLASLVSAAGGTMSSIVQLRTYLTRPEDLPAFFAIRNELYPQIFPDGNYPTNTLLVVAGLAEPDLLLEVEAVAAVDCPPGGPPG